MEAEEIIIKSIKDSGYENKTFCQRFDNYVISISYKDIIKLIRDSDIIKIKEYEAPSYEEHRPRKIKISL